MSEALNGGKPYADRPIFIFSAGWRSGSTLLQRLITSSKEVLVWGEAGGGLNALEDATSRFEQMIGEGSRRFRHGFGGYGGRQYQRLQADPEGVADKWIASMNPPLGRLEQHMATLLESYYGGSAAELGYPRWGVKEVQSGVDVADFLRRLFPNSKVVWLLRNPLDCITSIKRRNWIDYRGSEPAVDFFASHWRSLAEQFQAASFGKLVRYEDLIKDPAQLRDLSRYLEISDLTIDFVGKSRRDWSPENLDHLSWIEKRRIRAHVKAVARGVGYAV